MAKTKKEKEAEVGMRQPPMGTQNQGMRSGEEVTLSASWFWTFPLRTERMYFSFTPLGLWPFVRAALESQCIGQVGHKRIHTA
jgi:hypothetical protein